MAPFPADRISLLNDRPLDPDGAYVLYWMIANRRSTWNHALQRAVEHAQALDKPLVILEPLRCGYQWASDRLHRFIIDGMADNQARLADAPVTYYPYVEREKGEGKGLLAAFAEHAACVVTDEYPCFMLPRMVAAAAKQVPVRMEQVDANGILPMRAAEDRVFTTAYSFRRFMQKTIGAHFDAFPKADPLKNVKLVTLKKLPSGIAHRWPKAAAGLLRGDAGTLDALPIDHDVKPVSYRGGSAEAAKRLRAFLKHNLGRYDGDRNDVVNDVTSRLSPYLHFGHISAHEVFTRVVKQEGWDRTRLSAKMDGRRQGWWGMSESAEGFLDQLITWREVGFNMCFQRSDHDRYESLPDWAQQTLGEHARDPREYVYSLTQFERAETHDALWNAAQRQLVHEGIIHNYLRMLWGKKIIEWTKSPQEALAVMIELNNKYAVDGRDPNSYSGIFWVLGRHDRAWGPERPIFGKIRYMSSENTARKIKVAPYIERYGPSLFD